MIYAILRFILLWLPFRLVIKLYENKKALPANIKTRTGKILKAIMITDKYGILFSENEYTNNRVKYLREQQKQINAINKQIADEMNKMSFAAKEMFFEEDNENRINR